MNYKNALVITEAFMNLPEVKQAKKKYGAKGTGIILETLRQLNKCKNSLGVYIDIVIIAGEAGMNIKKLMEWYDDTHIFTVKLMDGVQMGTPEFDKMYKARTLRAIIYCGRTRMCFKNVPRDPTQEEIDDVLTNGSIYTGDNRKCMKKNTQKDAENEANSTKNKQKTNKNSSNFKLSDIQTSDTQQDTSALIHTPSHISSHSDIILQENNNIRNAPSNKTNFSSSCEQAEEEKNLEGVCGENYYFFREKIFSTTKEWKDSLKAIRDIDLNDEKTLCIFTKWMYNYCVCSRKMPENDDDFFHYIFALLDKRHATRKLFDQYYEEQRNEMFHARLERVEKEAEERRRIEAAKTPEQRKRERIAAKREELLELARQRGIDENAPMYKDTGYRDNGTGYTFFEGSFRYCFPKQIIPLYAIPQPNIDLRWSYIYNDWIAPEKYDKPKEVQRFHEIRDEILAKKAKRSIKALEQIERENEANEVCCRCDAEGIEVCSIYARPEKHPNRIHKHYKKSKGSPQFMFCKLNFDKEAFYRNTELF